MPAAPGPSPAQHPSSSAHAYAPTASATAAPAAAAAAATAEKVADVLSGRGGEEAVDERVGRRVQGSEALGEDSIMRSIQGHQLEINPGSPS